MTIAKKIIDTPFDSLLDRSSSDSVKWDRYQNSDILPLWIADTDFVVAPAISQALQLRAQQGAFGYTHCPARLTELVIERMHQLYAWQIQADWILWLPGVVAGLHLACRSLGDNHSRVLMPAVVYPHFLDAPELSGRRALPVPMVQHDRRWLLDMVWMADHLDHHSKLLLLCNPHNPGGSVYRREELMRLAELAERHDLIIATDEIHCDLILEPHLKHIPIATLDENIARRSITLMAASKTFNIAGLGCSFAIIPDPALRRAFRRASRGIVSDVNLFGYTATRAAFEDGDQWHQQQLEYLRRNRDYLVDSINRIRGLKLDPIEATHLAWIDVSELGLEDPPGFFEQAGVGLSAGKEFGDRRFMRLNFGCPRSLLVQAVSRINRAVNAHWH